MSPRTWSATALALLALAVATGAWAMARGDLRFALVVVIPVLHGTGVGALLPILLLMGAAGAWFASRAAAARASWPDAAAPAAARAGRATREEDAMDAAESRPRGGFGGVVLIGPVPVAFGNDRRLLVPLLVLALLVGLTFLAIALVRQV